MRLYSDKIALIKNGRGVYSLDTSIGCSSGTEENKRGCYGECYAAKSGKLYGYDFSKTVLRVFKNNAHKREIINQVRNIKLPFVRIGTSGDPSENWEHTLSIIDAIKGCNKQIVVITKHWTNLTDSQIEFISGINICINTSVSAFDKQDLLTNSLIQYNRLKPFCKSVLRIVSADFNQKNETGKHLNDLQELLFKNSDTLDTVLRCNKNNHFVKSGVINVTKSKFLGKSQYVSKYNKKTYLGKCSTCKEMCGIENMKPLTKQLTLL